jgi:hypothetical protein
MGVDRNGKQWARARMHRQMKIHGTETFFPSEITSNVSFSTTNRELTQKANEILRQDREAQRKLKKAA